MFLTVSGKQKGHLPTLVAGCCVHDNDNHDLIVLLLDVDSNSHEGLHIIGVHVVRAILIVWLRYIVQLSVGSFSVFGSLR